MTDIRQIIRGRESVSGARQVLRALRAGRAERVFVAADAADAVTAPVKAIAGESGVETLEVPAMRELGSACGLAVDTSCAAVLRSRP